MNNFVWKKTSQSVIGLSLALLAACVSEPRITDQKQPGKLPEPGTGVIVPGPSKPSYLHNAAIKKLLDKADVMIEKQNYDGAIQELERGLSISQNNPLIWQKMAEVRLYQGHFSQAEQLANKSNALSQGDDILRSKNLQIITAAKKSRQ